MIPVLIAIAAIFLVCIMLSYVCFRMAFYVTDKQRKSSMERLVPGGKIYEQYHRRMEEWVMEARRMPHRNVKVTSFDGLTLTGRFYEYAPGAPIEIMFHGYRGTAERDMSGGVQRCYSLKRSALIVDQRAASHSGGKVISFGINESRDVKTWVDFVISDQGKDAKIILTGISMGATTVMIAAGRPQREQVVGVIADCGFNSAKEIIMKVIGDMHLPAKILYPFVKAGARIFGKFNLEETTAEEAMKKCTVPVYFIHGEADDFVPCEMSRKLYEACAAPKCLFTVPGAGHGMGYLTDTAGYVEALKKFSKENGIPVGKE
ncbi:MAG: alpha/beta hydrolase [Clostridia bacterium]|nr:alpha/beta hydrolase [Clostridia bacterium]